MSTSSPIWMFQIDGEFFTIRPGQLILCWRNDDERQRLVDLVHAAFPAAAVFDPSDENGIRQSLGLDQLSLVHGLESFGPPTAVRDRMIRVTEQNGRISLNRLMFAGAGAVATPQGVTVDDCCDPAREDVAGGAGGGARLNPWYLNPWYLNPWYLNPWYLNPWYLNPWYLNRILLGEPVPRPPWATSAKPASSKLRDDEREVEGELVTVWILDSGLADYPGAPGTYLPNEPGLSDPWPATNPPTGDHRPDYLDRLGISGDHFDRPDELPFLGDGFVDPTAGHGTFIAGIYEQLAPGCDIKVKRVLGPAGDISEFALMNFLTEVMNSENAARTVVNLSFGGPDGQGNECVQEHLTMLASLKVAIVASAGNEGTCAATFPAAYQYVVGVGALDGDDPAPFSNYGSWVNTWAQGVDLHSCFLLVDPPAPNRVDEIEIEGLPGGWPGADGARPADIDLTPTAEPDAFPDAWATWSGTSFAAPVIGARIATQLQQGGASAWDVANEYLQAPEDPCAVDDRSHPDIDTIRLPAGDDS